MKCLKREKILKPLNMSNVNRDLLTFIAYHIFEIMIKFDVGEEVVRKRRRGISRETSRLNNLSQVNE